MRNNAISFEDGCRLLDKLFSEQTPVYAMLVLPTGTHARVTGCVAGITPQSGLLISSAKPPSSGAGLISLPFFERDCEFTFGDKRDIPGPNREELAAKFGDTIWCLSFPESGEFLILSFTTLAP
jgi:hypothetical protein